MAFRDDNVALRARIQTLEEEVRTLRGDPGDDDPLGPEPENAPKAAVIAMAPGQSSDHVAALIAAREDAEAEARRQSQTKKERARAARAARYRKRPRRVHVDRSPNKLRVHVARKLLRDALREDAEWHFWFFLINPGLFIVAGLAWGLIALLGLSIPFGVVLACVIWPVLLAAGNVLHARFSNSSYTIDCLEDGHFAIYIDGSSKPSVMGRRSEWRLRFSDPCDDELGWADIGDGRTEVALKKLSPADLRTLRAALGIPASS